MLELKDDGNTNFTAITTTNMPEERNYEGAFGISVVRRNGEIIYDQWAGTDMAYAPL